MTQYLARRLGFLLVALLVTSVAIFGMIRLAGGDVASLILGQGASPEAAAELRAEFGLDRALTVQYFDWISGLVTGDLGQSLRTGEKVTDLIVPTLQISVPLALGSLALAALVAVPVSILAARNAGNWVGSAATLLTQIGIAVPVFWAGVLLARLFGIELGWLPTGGWTPWSVDAWEAARSLVLPVLSMGLVLAATLSRFLRTAVMETMNEDYVRTARAYGMTRGAALRRVALRNAAVPMVTVVGLMVVELVGSTVVVETVFSLPGLSRMILANVGAREVLVVQSTVMVIVAFVLVVNLIVDLLYGLLDPRIRVSA